MNYFVGAIRWVLDPAHYPGPNGIPVRMAEQLWYTALTLVIACAIAIPIGYAIGHTGRGRAVAVSVTGGVRALPTLGVLTLVALWTGIGLQAPIVSFVVLAIPSILAGAYAGFEAVDRNVVDAARAVGMTGWQVLARVEVPLGLPLLIGGIRAAALQVVATATLAAYVGSGGLGGYLFAGLQTRDYEQMLAGALLVVVLALVLEGLFALVQRLVVPRGVVAQRGNVRTRPSRSRPVMGDPIEEGK